MNTLCTFFEPLTGRITTTALLSPETFEFHWAAGTPMRLDVMGDPAIEYVGLDTLELVPYSESERAALANLPGGWIWQMPERVAVDMRALAQAKAQARMRINAARDVAEHAPFVCNGLTYDADVKATARITGATSLAMMAAMAGQAFTKDWTLADNTETTLDGPGMMAVGAALGTRVGDVFDIARDLQAQIEAATTAAQADAINWP